MSALYYAAGKLVLLLRSESDTPVFQKSLIPACVQSSDIG